MKNILLITSDQQRWDTLGVYNKHIRTPNLDRLAARGIVFDKAYTANPVCTPSRCSMLTGQYPSRHGCYHVGTSLPEDYPVSVASDLAAAGYFTGILGKSHFQAEFAKMESVELKPHLLDFDLHRRWEGPHHGFGYAKINVGHSSEKVGCSRHYGVWLQERGIEMEKFFGIHEYAHFGSWELPEEVHSSCWVAEETIAAIGLAHDAGKPFFLWSNFPDPHNPYVVPEPWASMYDPEDMPQPEGGLGTEGLPPFYRALAEGKGYGNDPDLQERNWGDCRKQPEMDEGKTKKLWAIYYGMVSLMDHHIGRILDHLEKTGQLENTVVVFNSDHGDYLGDYGLWGKGLPTYDSVQRMPMIVSHPDCLTPGARSAAVQSCIDFRASFRDIAELSGTGVEDQGISQRASWIDAREKCREHAKIEFRPSQGSFFQNTFVTESHKLVLYRDREYGELYDMEADPLQKKNLWNDPKTQPLKEALVARFTAEVVSCAEECVRERTAYA